MSARNVIRVALTYEELDFLSIFVLSKLTSVLATVEERDALYDKLEGARAKLDPLRYKEETTYKMRTNGKI